MTGDDRPYVMAFSHMMGVGPLTYDKLIAHFGTARAAYEARERLLVPLIGTYSTGVITTYRKKSDPVETYRKLCARNIQVITRDDTNFPPQLRHIPDVPICLYVKGDIGGFDFSTDFLFAIVGTRDASVYGIETAKRFAGELTRSGMVIVSGMAVGIDGVAHRACLEEGGRTIVVLGCGVDVIYPYANRDLYHRIIKSGGIVISEFPPGMTVQKGLFIARNRLVTGLSRGVLVVEGTERSGSLISARFALDQGKDVFAVPGLITSQVSQAPHILIREGASIATTVNDILDVYRMLPVTDASLNILNTLPEEERTIYRLLLREPMQVDELIIETGFPISRILNTISLLEIKGLIGMNRGATYSARTPS